MIASAFLSAASLSVLRGGGGLFASGSNLWMVVFLALCFAYSHAIPLLEKRRALFCFIGGGILALCQSLGDMLTAGRGFSYAAALWPGYLFLYAAVLLALFAWGDAQRQKSLRAQGPAAMASSSGGFSAKALAGHFRQVLDGNRTIHFLMLIGLIILLWLPYYILFFPGLISADVATQISMGLGEIPLTSHHPIIYTAFLTGCMQVGRLLFGNFAAGIALATALQMLFTAVTAAWSLRVLRRLGVGFGFRVAAFLFFGLCPLVPWFAATLWKDVWLANFCLMLFLLVALLCRQRAAFFGQPWQVFQLVLASAGVLLSKNNGVYLLVFTILVLLLALAACRRQMAVWLLTCLLCFGLLSGPVYAALGVQHGDIREMLSLPLLQVARVVKYDETAVSDADKALLNSALPYDELVFLYDYRVSDSIKFSFDSNVLRQDPGAWLSLWLRLGLAAPQQYALATLEHTQGYWYPDITYWLVSDTPYPAYLRQEKIDFGGQEPLTGQYAEPFGNTIRAMEHGLQTQRSVPVLSLLYSIGFYFWVLLVCGLYALYCREYQKLIPLVPYLVLWLTCLASPVYAEFRYAWPAVFATVCAVGIIFGPPATDTDVASHQTK